MLVSHKNLPGRDSRDKRVKPKKLQNLTRHAPVRCRTHSRTCMLGKGKSPLRCSPTFLTGRFARCAAVSGDVKKDVLLKMCADAASCLPRRRLTPFQPRPQQEQHFTTRAQHLEDVQNMSGCSAHSRRHSTRVGKHRPPFVPPPLPLSKKKEKKRHLQSSDSEEGVYFMTYQTETPQSMLIQHQAICP